MRKQKPGDIGLDPRATNGQKEEALKLLLGRKMADPFNFSS
jgi:hypothetical protein